jgi:bifunctional UDP-N-acetylglucosamine pyrophosphorylase/glucosamine-1-phosphate N-acetyltransferase
MRPALSIPVIIVLAAGKGTRMKSSVPKILRRLRGKSLLDRVLDSAGRVNPSRIIVLTGHGTEYVRESIKRRTDRDTIEIILQEPQLGTGHAAAQCLGALDETEGTVLILSGDTPMVHPETLRRLTEARTTAGAAVAILSGVLPDPTGYGRVLRDDAGGILEIREQKDLSPGQEKVREVNLGIYSFDAAFLKRELPRLSNDNAQGEYYLTDLVQAASADGSGVVTCSADDPGEALGINTLSELSAMEEAMNRDYLKTLMDSGVRIVDPDQTWIEESVTVDPDVEIRPMCFLSGSTRIGTGSTIGPGAVIANTTIGRNVTILPFCVINDSEVDDGASVGPFAHLRPGSHLCQSSKIGNFVETKKSVIGEGSKVSHLSYVGDSELGRKVNIGAGCVTCNYDGYAKYRTIIEDGVFVGSGTMMVAPVTLGRGSLVAAGSTITKDVPADSLAVARSQQAIKEEWAAQRREKLSKEKKGSSA